MNKFIKSFYLIIGCFLGVNSLAQCQDTPISVSGIYPHLAYFNDEGECGTGAVVSWAERLWVISYGPHLPYGSSDKLYEITPDLQIKTRKESIGGTPANRMIHRESQQLFIGPYAIDANRNIRVIPYKIMPGRHTGNARHLTAPENKLYYATMEEGFYEVDVNNLSVKELYQDGNNKKQKENKENAGPINELLPGVHGKGLYSGQGVMVFSNNGEGSLEALKKFDVKAGVLAEWNGVDWKVIRRNQFVEVTGPGGIFGNTHPETDPIWATGWDHKSVILGVRDSQKGWAFFRLPKASHTYDGAHGWNTEWPRIRNIGTTNNPDYLMTMHGLFWRFPESFSINQTNGIRPRSAYLKVIGDFTRWNNRLVFGGDDSAQKEFLNKRKAKGNIEGPGQSQSNLWFTTLSKPDELGPSTANGAVWIKDTLNSAEISEPFLFSGWNHRRCWIKNDGAKDIVFTFEVDHKGNNNWTTFKQVSLKSKSSTSIVFDPKEAGEWVRVKVNDATIATVAFSYSDNDMRTTIADNMFNGLAKVSDNKAIGGLLYALGNNRKKLAVLANQIDKNGLDETGYYEMDEKLRLQKKEDPQTTRYIQTKFSIPQKVVDIDSSSVLIIDDQNRRWRLPLGNPLYKQKNKQAVLRICREVATERDLFSCMGTFYELPAENADGYAKIRPVSTHNFLINDYASYRGMMVLSGIDPTTATKQNPHIIFSDDRKAAVWVGVIDDLWKLGKPIGEGGPWLKTNVQAHVASDPFLIGFYDHKEMFLSHESNETIHFNIEVDPTGNGDWMWYQTCAVKAGNEYHYTFPKSFQARWIRISVDKNTKATAWFNYQ